MSGLSPAWVAALAGFAAALADSPRAESTAEGYLKHVGWLAAGVDVGPWVLSSTQLGAWLNEQNWSAQTRRKVTVSLRTFYAWAIADGYLEWSPIAGLPRVQHKKRGPRQLPLPPAWVEPLASYLTACEARAQSSGTLTQHRWYLRRLAECAADPWAVTTEQLEQWLANAEWAPQTKRSARSHASAFYNWAERAGRIVVSPARNLETVRVPRGVPRPAPQEALETALAAADGRVQLMLLLAAYGGLRRAEIASLHTASILDSHLVVTGKGGHQRVVPIEPGGALSRALQVELQRRQEQRLRDDWPGGVPSPLGWLFPSSQAPGQPLTAHRVGLLMARALPEKWAAHSLRHRFASAAYAATRDLRAVQELLGHARPETTSRYAAVPDGALLAAVAGAGLAGVPAGR